MIKETIRDLERRKKHMVYALQNRADELSLEAQHQIYGGVLELDRILDLLKLVK